MPAKDLYHNTVKTALVKDGWMITEDPLILKIGTRNALGHFNDYQKSIFYYYQLPITN